MFSDRPSRRGRLDGARLRQHTPHVEPMEARQLLATFTVTGIGDSGAGTLRQAILDANTAPGQDTIQFNITGSGPFSIAPLTTLPTITDAAVLDATTQPGYSGQPVIELNGSNVVSNSANGLTITAPNTTVRGFAINRFNGYGINVGGSNSGTIAGNYVGTDTTGSVGQGNRTGGILLNNTRGVTIGGQNLSDPNIVSANLGQGIYIYSPGGQPTGNAVLGNLVGTNTNASTTLGNSFNGIFVAASGVRVGGTGTREANTIAYNGGAGVQVGSYNFESGRTSNPIRGNAIFGNSALGIDLGDSGVTTSGSYGTGFGPNGLQDFPTINAAYSSEGGTTVEGRLTSTANANFTIDLYSNDVADPSGFGQGRVYLGSAVVTANTDGNADFAIPVRSVPTGQFITATATSASNNTSEFSRATSVTPNAQANLAVSIFASPDPAQVRGNLVYTVTVANTGPTRATNVLLTDVLPQDATYVSATVSQGTTNVVAGTLTAALGQIQPGSSATVRITIRPTVDGTISNSVNVRADQQDPDSGNNTASITTTVLPQTPADLNVSSFSSVSPLNVGQDQVYTVVVGNSGPNPLAEGVILEDTLPEGATFISATTTQGTFTFADGKLTANLGSLVRFGNVVVQITVRPTVPGRFTNTATVRGDQIDPFALNNTTTLQQLVSVASSDLSVSAINLPNPVRAGRPLSYTFQVNNTGPGDSTNTTLLDELDPSVTFVSATSSQGTVSAANGIVTANLGTIVAGQNALVTVVVIPSAIGTISNTATIRADQPDFNPANNVATTTTAVVEEVAPPTVLAQRLIVNRKTITGVVLTFSEAMDQDQAEALNNYEIRPSNSKGSPKGGPVALASARYDSRRHTVTLTFAKPLALQRFFALTANGVGASGLVDTSGNVLDGDQNNLPDGIFQATIGRGTITRPIQFQRDQAVPITPRVKHKVPTGPAQQPSTIVQKDVSLNLAFTKRLIRTISN